MKKILFAALTMILVLALAACSGNGGKTDRPEPEHDGEELLYAFEDAVAADPSLTALGAAEALSTNELLPFSAATIEVEPGYLIGFGNTEVLGFANGAMFAPMIGTIPFVGYVFELEEDADVDAFIATLESSADLCWNICTEAEVMTTGSAGNLVFFVMCNSDLSAE